ncbi:MAG TPA: PKD domain-containing protein [Thermoplasmata archaeon]|nr:PKD domain-containing protein [Thermoplasmata archaeon]
MSPTVAVVILVVVVVVAGVGGFFGLQAAKPGSTTSTTCSPASACATVANDVSAFVPLQPGNHQTITNIAAEESIPATVIPTGSETVKTYTIAWGDGTTTSSPSPTITHSYASAGLYVMNPSVTDTAGLVHTGTAGLFPVDVNLSFGDLSLGTYPSITTSFSNGTAGGYEPWVAVGTTVSVNASYIGSPPTPGWTNGAMNITVGTGVTKVSYTPGATSASGSYTLNTVGIDNITLHGSSVNGGTTLPFTYTWAVYVAPSATGIGCKYCAPPASTVKSPHSNSIVAYEVAPGGAVTIDPAGDYYTVGYEVALNVFQNLINYNGTDVGPSYPNYVPEIATCVAGSPQCAKLYGGDDLVVGDHYTFVIAKTAKFYDPTTGASWNVYPSDVLFSFIRQLAFADLPAVAIYPGWMVAQALLPAGNPSWDGGIHSPYNNTPQNILNSMMVNDTPYCPASAMNGVSGNGCITFVVNGAGVTWPAFLSYITNGAAGNIVPAGWYITEGATVPGFSTTGPDTPVLLPGSVNSTNTTAYQSYVTAQTPTGWDTYEELAITDYPTLEPNVAFTEVGSGPYFLKGTANPAIGYTLQANPDFLQPQGCAGEPWCQPLPGTYAKTVTVYWDDTDTAGIEAAEAGQADLVNIAPADTATLLALIQREDLKMTQAPSTGVNNFAYNTAIDLSALKTYDPYPINIQSDTFSYLGLRGFLDAAYPDATIQSEFNQIQGIEYGFTYGGFIPEYMGDYYPTNITWPNYNVTSGQFGNPSTNPSQVGSAAWWWAQVTSSGSQFYDPQFGSGGYSSANPLHVPALYFLGDPTHQSVLQQWSTEVQSLTGGAIVFDIFPVASALVFSELLPDGGTPWALYFDAWEADYAQPYDYWAAFGAASGTYSAPNTFYLTFTEAQFDNAAVCGHSGVSSWSNLTYWASQPYIPQDCQGVAYLVLQYWATVANSNLNLAQGALQWNRISAVYNLLNLAVDTDQMNTFQFVGPWINLSTLDASSLNGYPGGEEVWYTVQGNGVS